METKETSHACCAPSWGKHRKVCLALSIIVLLAIALLSVAAAGWKIRHAGYYGGMMNGFVGGYQNRMMGRVDGTLIAPSYNDQFVLPADATKSGKIAIVVNDLETAKKAVTDIAAKSGGSVHATVISYASDSLKNGSIVVQIPAENFDAAFAELKNVGSQVIQESTQVISPVPYYAVPEVAADNAEKNETTIAANGVAADSAIQTPSAVGTETSEFRNPSQQPQIVQKNGYIKVVFADYGRRFSERDDSRKSAFVQKIINISDPSTQDMRNNLIVVIAVKSIVLIAIFGLIVVVFRKIFHRIKRRKDKVKKVVVVRQLSKTRKQVTKVQQRKRK